MMCQTICAEPKRQPAQPLTSGMQFRRMRMQYISPSNKRAGSLNLYFFKMGIERDSLSVMAPLAALDNRNGVGPRSVARDATSFASVTGDNGKNWEIVGNHGKKRE